MKIRKVTESDLKEIAQIFADCYSEEPYNERWSKENVSKKINSYFKDCKILVTEEDNKIIGFVIFNSLVWDNCNHMYINEICVSRNYRGKGIGTALLNEVEIMARKDGILKLVLSSNINSKAFNLYEKLGYRKTDLIAMEKLLK